MGMSGDYKLARALADSLPMDAQTVGITKGRGLFPGHTCYTTEREVKQCASGFLMALVWISENPDNPPTPEYIQALAELYDLDVPAMNDFKRLKTEG